MLACDKYSFFSEIITNALISNTPKKKKMKNELHRNPVPWWDMECEKVKRLRKASFKKWQYSNRIEDFLEYKKYISIAKKHSKKKRKIV